MVSCKARAVLIRRASVRSECCPSTPWVFFHIEKCRNTEVGDRIKDVKTAVRSACKRAGLTGVTFRTLRHTCGSWLGQMSCVGALTIRDLLGHSSVTMTIGICMVIRQIYTTQYTSWGTFGHILGTVSVEIQMKPALATEESRINTRVKWWARLGLNQ